MTLDNLLEVSEKQNNIDATSHRQKVIVFKRNCDITKITIQRKIIKFIWAENFFP